jgi:serine/threonine-protein kinase
VTAGDYVGRPKDDARKQLEGLGLKVDEKTVDNPGTKPKDTVADVSPTGQVDPGSTITLSVYGDPVSVPLPDKKHGHGKGKGAKH